MKSQKGLRMAALPSSMGSRLATAYSWVPMMMFKTSTLMIAPAEAMATRPKLSASEATLSLRRREMPTARAKRKGTAKMPVVAPEESKAMAKNSGWVNNARTKMIR